MLQALEVLRAASKDINTAFKDVMSIANVLAEVLGVAAPKRLDKCVSTLGACYVKLSSLGGPAHPYEEQKPASQLQAAVHVTA